MARTGGPASGSPPCSACRAALAARRTEAKRARDAEHATVQAEAARRGVPQAEIVATLAAALNGDNATWLHGAGKYPVPAQLRLPVSARGNDEALLALTVRAASGELVPVRELVTAMEQALVDVLAGYGIARVRAVLDAAWARLAALPQVVGHLANVERRG